MLLFFFADGRYYLNCEERVNKPCQFFYNIPSYVTFPFRSKCEHANAGDDVGFGRKPAGYTKTIIAYDNGVVKDLATLEDYLQPLSATDSAMELRSVPIYLIILIAFSHDFYS